MKRRAITFLIAGTMFLSALGGITAFLAAAPNSTEAEQAISVEQINTEIMPLLLAMEPQPVPPPSPGPGPMEGSNGSSWSG